MTVMKTLAEVTLYFTGKSEQLSHEFKKVLVRKLSEGKREDELQQQPKAKDDENQAQINVMKKQKSEQELSGNSYIVNLLV